MGCVEDLGRLSKRVGRAEDQRGQDIPILSIASRNVVVVRLEVTANESTTSASLSSIYAHVKTSHPPSFSPRLNGNLTPTAPLFPMPPQNKPNVALSGLPSLPAVVASRAKTQSALPPCETRETRLYFSDALVWESDFAWEDRRD